MDDSEALAGRSKPYLDSSADTGAWESMNIRLDAYAVEWLTRKILLDPQGVMPERMQSALVHVNTNGSDDTGGRRVFRGRLDLPGRTMPVTVITDTIFPHAPRNPPSDIHLIDRLEGRFLLGQGTHSFLRKDDVVLDLVHTDFRTYLRGHPDADKGRLIMAVAKDIDKLHKRKFYGMLVPHSVLVNDFGEAGIHASNFNSLASRQSGLSRGRRFAHASDDRQAFPYLAPELVLARGDGFWGKHPPQTPHGDMYAFGMLVYEILSGREPWADAKLVDIFRYMVSGHLLPRPEGGTMDESMWNLCTACWDRVPENRPNIANVVAVLQDINPPTDWKPDPVVGTDHWLWPERPSLENEEPDRYATPTALEVDIDGSLITLVIPKQDTIAGAFGTVRRGYVYVEGTVKVYALKTCRGTNIMPRELDMWKPLCHHNVLPLLGHVDLNGPGLRERIFISPYLGRGNLAEYLKSTKMARRLPLMIDVATGLAYLHDIKEIVHGDIKPENILITEWGTAVLADFGSSTTTVAPSREETPFELRQIYTLTYCAPEVLDDTADYPSAPGVIRSKTKMSDMFAFGVLLYHTYSGGLGQTRMDRMRLMVDMYDGRFPPRPVGRMPVLCDDIWSICNRCWAKTPVQRPRIAPMRKALQALQSSPEKQWVETVEP